MEKTPLPDSYEAEILKAVRPLLERVRVSAYEAGQRDAFASLIQSARSRLQGTYTDAQSPARPQKPKQPHSARSAPTDSGRTRTPNGVIPTMTEEIVNASPEGIRQVGIIEMAKGLHGFDLKRSSLRVALDSLTRSGRIRERDGKWFPKGNGAPDAPLFNSEPSVQAAQTAGKEGGT